MSKAPKSPLDDAAKALFGDSIAEFARGNEHLERHAASVLYPTIAALEFPEEYAFLVLTTRMEYELQKLIQNGVHKQGNAKKLLNRLLYSFEAKIGVAYCFGFMTEQIYNSLEFVRKIRNLYAHSEDPHLVRQESDYKNYRKQLIELDPAVTKKGAEDLHTCHVRSASTPKHAVSDFELIGILVTLCDKLGLAAFYSQNARFLPQSGIVPAFYGMDDAPVMETVGGHAGFFPGVPTS